MSGSLIAIDPGKSMGWAYFDETTLLACGLIKGHPIEGWDLSALSDRYLPTRMIVEIPQIYVGRKQKGDPNDLIKLAIIAGRAIESFRQSTCSTVLPRAWKGTRPKDVDNAYTLTLLSLEEKLVVEQCGVTVSKINNVIDAIGIGLWALKRR